MLPDVISERNVLGGICETCVFISMCVHVCAVCACMSEWVAEEGFFVVSFLTVKPW